MLSSSIQKVLNLLSVQCPTRSRFYSKNENILHQILMEMSKNPKQIGMAQKQPPKHKLKDAKFAPGKINLQVLGTGSPGSPSSLYLFSDEYRYLFNCGEGTQRLANEHRTKLTRLDHIFMTRTSWRHIGGLPGLSLTLQDIGVNKLTLHGPPKLDEIFTAMRRFVWMKNLQVEAPVCETGQFYEDAVLKINYLRLERKGTNQNESTTNTPPETLEISDDVSDYYANEENCPDRPISPARRLQETLEKSDETSVMAFICKFKPRLGKLSLEKCVEKGVTPGPILGKLKNGENITLPNGDVVYAADVRDPDDPGPQLIIIDIPSQDYLENIEDDKLFEQHFTLDLLEMVVHFTPEDIAKTPQYQRFIKKFPATTKHWFINEGNRSSGNIGAHRQQWRLNQLSDSIFPILGEPIQKSLITNSPDEISSKKFKMDEEHMLEKTQDVIVGNENELLPMTWYHLRPRLGLDRTHEALVVPDEYINDNKNIEGFLDALNKLKQDTANLEEPTNRSDEYPKIVFLGTGSCIPNKTRNVSAILVHITNESSILLDCGEGTAGQIHRFYGSKAPEIFKKIKCIAITHLHADHHLGLIGVIQERRRALGENASPLLLLGPTPIKSWLDYYNHRIEPIAKDYTLVLNADLVRSPLDSSVYDMGLLRFEACFVHHCPHSFGFSLTIDPAKTNKTEPIKITYSGDTMPCQNLVDLGQNSTLLIHEATMEDELHEEALLKAHSTVSQAIDQSRKMKAKYTLLTHFSQRYSKIPRIEQDLTQNVGIAFDNMEVVMSDLDQLSALYPAMKKLFAEDLEEMESKSIKRTHRKNREMK